MKELIILRGLPGSGKSTFAKLLANHKNSIVIENDEYMYEDGIYDWKPSKVKLAAKNTNEKLHKALNQNVELIVISNVNARNSDFYGYIELGKNKGYKVTTLIVENYFDGKSIHGVNDETLDRMESNFQIKLR